MNLKEWILLILLSFIWGGSFFFGDVALKSLPPFTVVAFRVSFAALIFYVILGCQKIGLPKDYKILGMFFMMGLLNNAIPFSLILWGQKYIASSLAAILNAGTPIFTIFVAHFCTKDEKLSFIRFCGTILGFLGVAVVIGWNSFDFGILFPQVLVVSAGFSYSLASVFGKTFRHKGLQPMIIATGQLSASSLILLIIANFVDGAVIILPPLEIWLAVLGFALFCTNIAYILYFKILASAGANNVILVTVIAPLSAIALGVLFLDEQLYFKHLVGLVIIIIALLIIDQRIFRLFHKIKD